MSQNHLSTTKTSPAQCFETHAHTHTCDLIDFLIVLGELNTLLLFHGTNPLVQSCKSRLQSVVVDENRAVIGTWIHAPEEESQFEGLVDGNVFNQELKEFKHVDSGKDDPVGDPLDRVLASKLCSVAHPGRVNQGEDCYQERRSIEVSSCPQSS
eukprot:sb/3473316/